MHNTLEDALVGIGIALILLVYIAICEYAKAKCLNKVLDEGKPRDKRVVPGVYKDGKLIAEFGPSKLETIKGRRKGDDKEKGRGETKTIILIFAIFMILGLLFFDYITINNKLKSRTLVRYEIIEVDEHKALMWAACESCRNMGGIPLVPKNPDKILIDCKYLKEVKKDDKEDNH